MKLPDSWTEKLPFLEALEEEWRPVPRIALWLWIVFYAAFLWGLAAGWNFPHLMDLVFVPVHEGGHLLFRWFGEFLSVAGGTFLQLAAPFALAVYFVFRRQAQGAAFCLFFFFEQFIPIATYMADARAQELPLLTVGDSDDVIHDWNYLLGRVGLLSHDTQIAYVMRIVGWLGMIATVVWFIRKGWNRQRFSAARN
jgi:hypothetical protein